MAIVNSTYKITENFPKEESKALTARMRKSASSIPSYIKEGLSRGYDAECQQFLYAALESCGELEKQIIDSFNQSYLSDKIKEELLDNLRYESRMIVDMMRFISGSLIDKE